MESITLVGKSRIRISPTFASNALAAVENHKTPAFGNNWPRKFSRVSLNEPSITVKRTLDFLPLFPINGQSIITLQTLEEAESLVVNLIY